MYMYIIYTNICNVYALESIIFASGCWHCHTWKYMLSLAGTQLKTFHICVSAYQVDILTAALSFLEKKTSKTLDINFFPERYLFWKQEKYQSKESSTIVCSQCCVSHKSIEDKHSIIVVQEWKQDSFLPYPYTGNTCQLDSKIRKWF